MVEKCNFRVVFERIPSQLTITDARYARKTLGFPLEKETYCISKVISITYLKNVSQIFPTLCTACQLQAKACSTQYAEFKPKKKSSFIIKTTKA